MEDVVGVVRRFHVYQPVVDGIPVRLANPVTVFIAAEKVDVHAFAEGAEGGEERLGSSGVAVPEALAGPPHTIKGNRVRRLPVAKRRPALGHPAYRPL